MEIESSVFIFKRKIVTVLGQLDPDDRGTKILRNGPDYCLNDIQEGLDLQQHPLWEPQTSQQYTVWHFLSSDFLQLPATSFLLGTKHLP